MMLHKNTKAMIYSLDGETDFFDIVTVVLQGDTLALYMFIICLDHELRTSVNLMKENGFTLKKSKKQTIFRKNYMRRRLRR